MRFGICFGIEHPEQVKMAKDAGFDYIEGGFCTLSRGDEETFLAFKTALEENDIKCEAANGFFPRDLPLIGDEYDEQKVTEYIENGLKRGVQIGLKKVAFGSSRARNVPDNMSYSEGFETLGKVLGTVIAPLCEKYGVKIVTEPLQKNECNIINTIKEGVMLSVLSGRKEISTLGDNFHMQAEGDTFEDVRQLKGCLSHCHISNPNSKQGLKRDFPMAADEWDYKGFIEAMEYAGVDTCSVEAQTKDFATDIVKSGAFLKSL